MSERTHKRKRDSLVDVSKIRMALNRLEVLKTELEGIEETEEEMQSISEHVLALKNILEGTKKPRVDFSAVTEDDLEKAGVVRKRLIFKHAKMTALANGLTKDAEAEIADLLSRMKKIYAHVNMDYAPGSRMLLDAILLALAEILTTSQRLVAIFPKMRIGKGDGVQISHPDSGYKLWLSGNVDCVVIEYEDVKDYKARLLGPGGSRKDAFEISKGRLFLIEAKRMGLERDLVSHIPEAVSQAIALLKSEKPSEVRFCLSDGRAWIFFILKSVNGILTYYESAMRSLDRRDLETSDRLREIMQLVSE